MKARGGKWGEVCNEAPSKEREGERAESWKKNAC